jgi:hypothetical protein
MEASQHGIDIGGRTLDALLAFVGENEEQNRVYFKVKGKKCLAAATGKARAIEVEGSASEDAEQGEWPVEASFLRKLANMTEEGSPRVPAVVARLICDRTGVSTADLIVKETGKACDTVRHHAEMPQNKQLSFSLIHRTITVDFEGKTSWFPLERKSLRALTAVYAAAGKGSPVSYVGGPDEQSPVAFQAQGQGITIRGILIPPAVVGPGKAAVEGATDDDGDEETDDKTAEGRTGDLFAKPSEKPAEGTDDTIIPDEEAARIKAAQRKRAPLATEKPKAARRRQKNPKAGSR